MTGKTSIVMTAYNNEHLLQANISSAALGNISKYTDRDDYELIFVDQKALEQNRTPDLNSKHHCITIDNHLRIDHIGMSAAMNYGYKQSSPECPYVCFMHNDVFIWEGWLPIMRKFLEDDPKAIVMPAQGSYSRDNVKTMQSEESPKGNDDAGMVMMTKETFKKTGGWDERFKGVYQDAAFRLRFPVSLTCTGKIIITHICSINMYTREQMGEEGNIWEKLLNGEGKNKNYL